MLRECFRLNAIASATTDKTVRDLSPRQHLLMLWVVATASLRLMMLGWLMTPLFLTRQYSFVSFDQV